VRVSRPDAWGSQTLRYDNGASFRYEAPDAWGNRGFQQQTMAYQQRSIFNR
jgi:hypothetical protein